MRKTLILGSLLAVFLMMLLPTVAATEAKVAQSATTPYLLNAQSAYIEAIRAKYKDNPSPQTIILLTLAILLLKLLRWGVIFIGAILLVILKIIRNNNTTGVTC